MTAAVMERDKIVELAEMEEIKALRAKYREDNEELFANGGIKSVIWDLLAICDQNIYVGKEAAIYFDILDMRDFLQEKYAELSATLLPEQKEKIEEALTEANESLTTLRELCFQ